MLLQVNSIDVYYGSVQALKGVSLEVNEGEITSLIGSNGAGKSTLLKTISGLLKPASGSISFMGHRIDGLPPENIVSLGIAHVPEGRMIFPAFSVLDNLRIGAVSRFNSGKPKKEVLKEIEEDIERVFSLFPRLKERKNQLGWSLSGGEQQMLAVGRGLMARPKLLLLDEPSLGLAPYLVKEVFNIIKTINAQGTSIMVVEQNARMALKASHKAYVLETGEIVLSGPSSELLKSDQVRAIYLGAGVEQR